MRRTTEQRFWGFVRKSDGCWEWIGGRNTAGGYGCFYVNSKRVLAHRYSYTLHFGDPGEMYVCHTCDNKSCVRPDHFFLGTHADNIRDAVQKGLVPRRPVRGERCPWAKLTDSAVRALRERYARGGVSYKALADEIGVSEMTVLRAVKGQAWTHL